MYHICIHTYICILLHILISPFSSSSPLSTYMYLHCVVTLLFDLIELVISEDTLSLYVSPHCVVLHPPELLHASRAAYIGLHEVREVTVLLQVHQGVKSHVDPWLVFMTLIFSAPHIGRWEVSCSEHTDHLHRVRDKWHVVFTIDVSHRSN